MSSCSGRLTCTSPFSVSYYGLLWFQCYRPSDIHMQNLCFICLKLISAIHREFSPSNLISLFLALFFWFIFLWFQILSFDTHFCFCSLVVFHFFSKLLLAYLAVCYKIPQCLSLTASIVGTYNYIILLNITLSLILIVTILLRISYSQA